LIQLAVRRPIFFQSHLNLQSVSKKREAGESGRKKLGFFGYSSLVVWHAVKALWLGGGDVSIVRPLFSRFEAKTGDALGNFGSVRSERPNGTWKRRK
jgi:hypothetical protein